jgi:diguanylate cyclase (GGDEF)-like protein
LELKDIKKFTFIINTIILVLVFMLAAFFVYCKATFLIWFSIPTALVYVIGFFLIKKDHLEIYTRVVYFWLTLYMSLCTVCLGYRMGFHLYCMSMIPIAFYAEFMADKLGKKKINAFATSGIIAFFYLVSTGYSASAGAIYEVGSTVRGLVWTMNSVITISFMIMYSRLVLNMIGDYEKKLKDVAHRDRLTGLYNRHFMMDEIEKAYKSEKTSFVIMSDIDNFKKINDQYGHNAGDFILVNIARIMRETCKTAVISRWGGEEFLILITGKEEEVVLTGVENFRKKIEAEDFVFDGQHIKVTITSGVAVRAAGHTIDGWINEADNKLYAGKNSGKNKVVF